MDVWQPNADLSWKNDTNVEEFQSETILLGSDLAYLLGEAFSFPCQENNISSLLYDPNLENQTNLLADVQDDANPNNSNIINDANDNINLQSTKDRKRKRRDSEQTNAHILSERKRRQLIAQRFIALAALIPGLKKVDKSSILDGAIELFQKMHEKIKTLEEDSSKRAVRPASVAKRKLSIVDDNKNANDSYTNALGSSGGGDDDSENDHQIVAPPEIDVKVSGNALLLQICGVRRRPGMLARIYNEIEKRQMRIVSCNIIRSETGSSLSHITIFAQIEAKVYEHDKHFAFNPMILRTLLKHVAI